MEVVKIQKNDKPENKKKEKLGEKTKQVSTKSQGAHPRVG